MLISYNWLQDYVDVKDFSPQEVAEKLTRGGIEVDYIHQLGEGISGVVVGYVEDCKQHPNADKLRVCQVNIGEEEPVQIVCGAPNVAKGQHVVVAKVGAILPGNFKIKKAKLRGETSQGMICSLQELGIDSKLVQKEFSEGIYVFQDEVKVGSDALAALNLNDAVLEVDLTPNRADCLNMLGVAYEVGALYDRNVSMPTVEIRPSDEQAADYISVKVEAEADNPLYCATIIKNVKVGPSPLWMQNRLRAAGIRPISNVVDVTNFVLLEYGQPLHAFDYDRFGSKEVVVRRAHENEKIVTLDDQERTLTEENLVITNGKEPVAVAGVMGGATSEVQADTTTILLEAAYFNGVTVRKSSRALGLRSDSSARFEKGIDPSRVRAAAERATSLIAELAGGTVVKGVVESDVLNFETVKVPLDLAHVNDRLGTEVTLAEVKEFMRRLRFEYEETEYGLLVTAPTRRPDIRIEEDLMEEVARLYGYDRIPTTLPLGATIQGGLSDYQQKRRSIRRVLEGAGLSEVITYSLTSTEKAGGFATERAAAPIRVAMPMSEEHSTMRTSLIPHLLDVITYNLNRKNQHVHIYEIGSIFLTDEVPLKEQPVEQEMIAGALTGHVLEHAWQGEKKSVDFFVVKGILEQLFTVLGVNEDIIFEQTNKPDMHPGRTAVVKLAGREIGFVGQVHPAVQKEKDLRETYVYELNLQQLLKHEVQPVIYERLPRFPSIIRDIALVVDRERSAGELEAVIHEAGGSLLNNVRLFDFYEGEHIEEGKKSLAFSLTYLDPERTLTDEEVAEAHNKVIEQLKERVGANLRE